MPTISIVTAVLDGTQQHIKETYASLVDQELPAGWNWQWVVQEDGHTGRPAAQLPDDPRISTGMAERGRAATARTVALSRVTGHLLRGLDADDVLPPGALSRDITALLEHPECAWCVSPTVDLLPDGSLRPGPRDPDPGPLEPGFLAIGEAAGMLQVVGSTMCTYTDLVRALGGWQALPTEEDVALLLAVEAVSDGWMLDTPGLYYRRWEHNTSDEVDKRLASESHPRRQIMLDRVRALRASGWHWSPSSAA